MVVLVEFPAHDLPPASKRRAEVSVIVNVAVQDYGDQPVALSVTGIIPACRRQFSMTQIRFRGQREIIYRVAVVIRDGADGCPAGVGKSGFKTGLQPGEFMKQGIAGDALSQFPDITSQFTDDGRGLEGEGDCSFSTAFLFFPLSVLVYI